MTFLYLIGWLPVTIIAYSFHAFAVILDKFLLAQRIQRPSTYVFWVGVLGLGAFFLAPISFFVPETNVITDAFISGVAFTFALFFFYIAIQRGEASRVAPVIGGLSPIFVFFLSRGILGETLSRWEFVAFLILVAGSILISLTHKKDGRFNISDLKNVGWLVLASFLFGVTYVYEKAVFNETDFINGFIWTRIGGFVGVLPFLFFSASRESIFEAPRMADRTTIGAFFINKILGALGFFLVSFAISIAPSVSLVNALQGIEYVLIFIFALLISRLRPKFLEEEVTPLIIFEKAFAILLIAVALALLAFQ
ncbi:MAG: EamA family transporter [Candidatus Sungbacteria bacterium]|nr:EamA family transporter [Candidatus Sungbacteria bacterium]